MQEPVPCDILLTAAFLVTQDDDRRIIEDAALAVADGKVLALGPRSELRDYAPAAEMHLGDALIMPGLVNAHTHAAMTFLRGFADDLPLMEWLTQNIFPVEKHLKEDIVRLGALLGCAEMLRTGTTAFADMYLLENAVCEAAEQAGLNILAGEVLFSFPSPAYRTPEDGLALVREKALYWKNHPRVHLAVMPHAVYTTTPELLRECYDLAREFSLPLHIHLAETRTETATCIETHGKRPVEYCRSLGFLEPGTFLAHAVDLAPDEVDLLAETGTRVVHCPKSNMKLASGVSPVSAMLAHGMLPGLGTDGAASNNSLNMFAEMSACALLHKVSTGDPTVLPAQTVLDMATLGGAAAIGRPELGRLTPGGPADLVALDLGCPNMQPVYSPVSQVVYAASGHEVCLTMVGGKTLYDRGTYRTLDCAALFKEVQALKKWVLEKRG